MTRRIGIVIGQLSQGGAERQCLELAAGLQRAGAYAPVVLCTSTEVDPYGPLLAQAGIEWDAVPGGTWPGLGKRRWLLRAARARECRLLYGLLHVGNIYAGLAAHAAGAAFVASIRNAMRPPWLLRQASAYVCRRAAAVVANSEAAARSLEMDLGVRRAGVAVIPNAVRPIERSPADRDALRRELGVPPEAILVGTVANLKRQKRVDFFLQAARRVHEMSRAQPALRALGPHYVWVGDGADRSGLGSALAAMPPDLRARIHFPGASTEADRYLAAFDVFVLTSAYEGMPNALLEAMSAGLPCVATDVPGTHDVLAQTASVGRLADAGDPQRFAQALVALVLDRTAMARLGRAAAVHVRQRYTREGMVQAHAAVFDEVMERRVEGNGGR